MMVGKDKRSWPSGSASVHNKLLVLGETLVAPAVEKRNQREGSANVILDKKTLQSENQLTSLA